MAVSITTEQKLVFCLAQNIVHLGRSFDAFKISRILVECGVLDGYPLPVGEQCKEATFLLLKHLFEMWSLKNGARREQFRIFRLAVGEAGNREILEECLPDLGCSEEELNAHFLHLKNIRNDDVAKWLTPYTATFGELLDSPSIRDGRKALKLGELTALECSSILQKILSHYCCDISTVWQLLASSSFLMDENRILTLGQTLERPLPGILDEIAMKKRSAQQLGICQEVTHNAEELSGTEESLVHCALHEGEIGQKKALLVSPASLMEKKTGSCRKSVAVVGKANMEKRASVKFNKCEGMLQSILSLHKRNGHKVGLLQASSKYLINGESKRTPMAARRSTGREERSLNETSHVPSSYEYLLFKFAFEEVHIYWKQMGISLGFDRTELDAMDQYHQAHRLGSKDMAWAMLHKYWQWKGQSEASIEYLRSVLIEVKVTVNGPVSQPFLTESTDPVRLVGREKEIRSIQTFFWNHEMKNYLVLPMTARRIQVLAGIGGVGKTSLAKCYAQKHAKAYSDGVFHFNAESYGSLLTSIRQNLSAIQTAEEETKATALVSENAQIFVMYLSRHPRSLIIFDNVDERELVRECIPDASIPCHILITTRSKDLFRHEHVDTLVLQKLEEDCAIGALLSWAGKESDSFEKMKAEEREFAQKLAVDPPVEGLPLALAHAGIFIEQHNITFRMYWRRLQAKKGELDAAALGIDKFLAYFRLSHLKEALQREGVLCPSDLLKARIGEVSGKSFEQSLMMKAVESLKNRRHVHLTWEMDLDDIKEKYPNSYLVLQCCSVLSCQDIPLFILSNSAFPEEEEELREISLAISARCLKERSFLEETERNDSSVVYSMHHLIQASVLERLWGDTGLYENILQTVGQCLIQRLFPLVLVGKGRNMTHPLLISLLPHVYSVAKRMLEFGMNSEKEGDVIDLACALSLAYAHVEVVKSLNALRIKNLENTPDSLGIHFNKQGQLTECYIRLAFEASCSQQHQAVYQLLYLGFEKRSPDELTNEEFTVPAFVHGLQMLVNSYLWQDLFDKAQLLLSRMVTVYSSKPSAKDELWLTFMKMSFLYYRQGKYQRQLEVMELARPLYFSLSTLKDGRHAYYCLNYGLALESLKRHREALLYFTKSLDIYKATLPENNILIANGVMKIGNCLCSLDQYTEAVEQSREALAMARSVLPPQHVELCAYLRTYSRALIFAQRIPEAAPLLEECLSVLRTFPPDIVEIRKSKCECLFSLGGLFSEIGRERDAISTLEECLRLTDKTFFKKGSNMMFLCSDILGKVYSDINRKDDALPHFRRAFSMAKELPSGGSSFNESSIRMAVQNFFSCLLELERFSEAKARILEFFDSPMSNDHLLAQQINMLYNELLDIRS